MNRSRVCGESVKRTEHNFFKKTLSLSLSLTLSRHRYRFFHLFFCGASLLFDLVSGSVAEGGCLLPLRVLRQQPVGG